MSINKAQKALVTQLQLITGSDSEIALSCLKASSWNLEAACNIFFDGGSSGTSTQNRSRSEKLDQTAIATLFDKYRDEHADSMLAEGVGAFCEDLQVDPADIVMLVISHTFQAEHSCEFSRREFMAGMTTLGCDSIQKLVQKLPALRLQLRDPHKFQEVYTYAYGFSCERGQKCMQLDMAIPMWRLLFSAQPWPLLEAWCDFLTKEHRHAISRDTWVQLLEFSKTVDSDLSNFEENAMTSAWPYLIDDFVAHVRTGASFKASGKKAETSSSGAIATK